MLIEDARRNAGPASSWLYRVVSNPEVSLNAAAHLALTHLDLLSDEESGRVLVAPGVRVRDQRDQAPSHPYGAMHPTAPLS